VRAGIPRFPGASIATDLASRGREIFAGKIRGDRRGGSTRRLDARSADNFAL